MPNPLIDHIAEKIFSVAEYLDLVNELLGPLKVSVEGEITDLKILPQWVFFSLKDVESGSILRCGLHAGVYRRLGVNVEEGMMVKVAGYGKISPTSGNFGFWVSAIEPVGEGALRRAYELLVKKLQEEGLFTRKRELPQFISHIGVISSRNGVVIQDLMKNLKPLGIRVDFIHSGVEGAGSAPEILKGIQHFNTTKEKPQVLVVIRGGGSLESLQGFNNEAVVRTLYASTVPVLVGIGHDVDAPIATMVADWSASTPTAVAHVINDSWAPLTERLPNMVHRITRKFTYRLRDIEHSAELALQNMRLPLSRIVTRFRSYEDTLRRAQKQIRMSLVQLEQKAEKYTQRFVADFSESVHVLVRTVQDYERLLSASDPKRVLARGYGLVYGSKGTLVRSVGHVTIGETVTIRLHDGSLESKVITKEN